MFLLRKCRLATCNQCNVSTHICVKPHLLIYSDQNIFTSGIYGEFCSQEIYRVFIDAFWKKYQKKPQILYITYSYNSFKTLHQLKGIYIKTAEQYA